MLKKTKNILGSKNNNFHFFRFSSPSVYLHLQNLVKFYTFFLKILRRNKILLPMKGHNFVTNLKKITGKNPIDTDLVNINAFIKFGQILSICSKDTERK